MQKRSMLLLLLLLFINCHPEEEELLEANFAVHSANSETSRTATDANRIRVKNIEALRKLPIPNKNRKEVNVMGYYEPHDGGGGVFTWNPESTENDNGGTVIASIGDEMGRWERNYEGAVNVKWFGVRANGEDDDTKGVQKAMGYSAENTLNFPNGTYKISSTLLLESNSKYIGEKAVFLIHHDVSLFRSLGPLESIILKGFSFKTSSDLKHAYSPVFDLWKNGGVVNSSFSDLTFSNVSILDAVFKIGDVSDTRFHKIKAKGCGTLIALTVNSEKSERIEIEDVENKNGKSQTISLYSPVMKDNNYEAEKLINTVSIKDVYAEKCEGVAISIYKASKVLIENCKVIDSWDKKQTDPLQNCGIRIVGSEDIRVKNSVVTRQGEEVETLLLDQEGKIIKNQVVHGLNIEKSKNVYIQNCSFSFLNGNGINLLNGGENIFISECSVKTTYNGDGIAIHGLPDKTFKKVFISQCKMENLSYDYYPRNPSTRMENYQKKPYTAGVYADYVEDLKIFNLEVYRSGRGITLANGTKKVKVENLLIENMMQCGISFSSGIVEGIEFQKVTINDVGENPYLEDWRRAGILITANFTSDVIFHEVKITSESEKMKYGFSVGWGNQLQRVKLNNFQIQGYSIAPFNLSSQEVELSDDK